VTSARPGVTLILVTLGVSLPIALAADPDAPSTFESSALNLFAQKVVATTDSKGRVHAAWIEKDDWFDGSGKVALWYSTYNPENSAPRMARLLDSSPLIYSLSLTIDNADEVHTV